MELDEVTRTIISSAIEVHKYFGPGLLECVYENSLKHELLLRGCKVVNQVPVSVKYKGIDVASDLKLDLLVDDEVIVELKSVEELKEVHYKQLLTYLRLLNKQVGLLINFNEPLLKDGLHRLVNNYIE